MRKLIYGVEYSVNDRLPGRVDPIGDLVTNPIKWTEVKTPMLFNDLSGGHSEQRSHEYQRFNNWFKKECIGCYQYLYRGTFLFSEEIDVLKYHLRYYYD